MRPVIIFAALLLWSCTGNTGGNEASPGFIDVSIEKYPVNTSIRALEVLDSNRIFYAGSNGKFGYTLDGGTTWVHDSIREGENPLEIRAIAVNKANVIHLLNAGSPAYLFRSEDLGETWDVVYREEGPSVFYDAMTFWDEQEGIAMGDPVDDCISVIVTRDGGKSWSKLACEQLPGVLEGEAAFAASNTNIAVEGENVWIGTGGGAARIYHSADRGRNWTVHDTPVIQGGTMTGIFTIDFFDQQNGVIMGGDWEKKPVSSGNLAVTNDGGKTWQLISEGKGPGYRSCIRYVPGGGGRTLMAAGIPGTAYSPDGGRHWQLLTDEDFYTLRFDTSGKYAWLAGNGKLAKMQVKYGTMLN